MLSILILFSKIFFYPPPPIEHTKCFCPNEKKKFKFNFNVNKLVM